MFFKLRYKIVMLNMLNMKKSFFNRDIKIRDFVLIKLKISKHKIQNCACIVVNENEVKKVAVSRRETMFISGPSRLLAVIQNIEFINITAGHRSGQRPIQRLLVTMSLVY